MSKYMIYEGKEIKYDLSVILPKRKTQFSIFQFPDIP